MTEKNKIYGKKIYFSLLGAFKSGGLCLGSYSPRPSIMREKKHVNIRVK